MADSRDWRADYRDAFSRVRDQLRRERASGGRPRFAVGAGGRRLFAEGRRDPGTFSGLTMKDYSDSEIDRYARTEAERRTRAAIREHHKALREKGIRPPVLSL